MRGEVSGPPESRPWRGPERVAGEEGEMKKKLIEVVLPLEAINIASGPENSIRYGHPSTLHCGGRGDRLRRREEQPRDR